MKWRIYEKISALCVGDMLWLCIYMCPHLSDHQRNGNTVSYLCNRGIWSIQKCFYPQLHHSCAGRLVISQAVGKIYSDRKRMRGVLTITTLGFGLAYMSYSLAQNIGQFYISAVILGFFWAGACFMPVSMMITAWSTKCAGWQ